MATITVPGMFLTGDHASRPAATAVGKGTLYSCTTHSLIYQTTDGATWVTWLTAGSTVSAGSNSTRVREVSTAGASSTLWSPFDHAHDGIGTITASSSNTLQRGTFNLRTGNNISFGLTDSDGDGELDTMTIHGAAAGGGGGSSLTVADEGTPLSTAATTLDFVGAGVTATGSGATKTITIAGGASDSRPYLDSGTTLIATYGDDFTGSSLDARWTATGAFDADAAQYAVASTWLQTACRSTTATTIYQTGPTKETFEVITSQSQQSPTANMVGPAIVSSSGTGVGLTFRFDTSQFAIVNIASYAYTSDGNNYTIGGGNNVTEYVRGAKHWLSLKKVPTNLDGDIYFGRWSLDGFTWSREIAYDPSTFTYAKMGWGRLNGGANNDLIAIDRFNVVDALDVGNNLVITPTSGTPTYSASSSFGGLPASNAANGTSGDWAANTGNSDSPFYWEVAWSVGQDVNRVCVKERSGDQFGLAHVELFDGATTFKYPFREVLAGSALWHVVDFPTVTGVDTLRIVSDGGGGANGGFIEVEAYLRS